MQGGDIFTENPPDPVTPRETRLKYPQLSPLVNRGVLAWENLPMPQAICDHDLCLPWAVARWAQSQLSQSRGVGRGKGEGSTQLQIAGHPWGEEASLEHLALTLGGEGHPCSGYSSLLIHY